ncbi:MAG: S9 family peptidase [Candidatus Heimdallarchaeota archaeon]|nr:S9 family peptidase [Candidatus Heimdallarchaeota archaeon]
MSEKIISEDYLKFKFVEEVVLNKDQAFFVERSPDAVNKTYLSHIKQINRLDGSWRQFTGGSKKDMLPKISPDNSKLAFLSSRNGQPQLFLMEINGGEAIQATTLEKPVLDFDWSFDSKKIAIKAKARLDSKTTSDFLASGYEKEQKEMKDEHQRLEEQDPRVLEDIVYRADTSFFRKGTFNQIYIYSLENDFLERITQDERNYSSPGWFDQDHILVTISEEPEALSDTASLLKINILSKEQQTLSTFYYPDRVTSKPIAFEGGNILLSVMKEGNIAGQNAYIGHLQASGDFRLINESVDRSADAPIFTSSVEGLCLVEDSGKARIYRFNLENSIFELLFEPESSITNFDGDQNEIYFTATDPMHPWAIWKWTSVAGSELLYDPNQDYLTSHKISSPEEFWLTNPEGQKYQNWFFEAENQNGQKPPLILSVHGGPHVMWNNAGTMWHEWQTQVAAGYSVLAMNPIGSSGYGEQFAQLITSKWGEADARDLLSAVDHLIDRVNPDRLYITGGSYAGYQTANVIAIDHRFKAACAQRGVYNLISFWSTTDIPKFEEFEWEGDVWERYDLLWHHSPISKAKSVQTPLLIIHGENDFRVNVEQAEELFAAYKKLGKEVLFVRYPRDGHELSRSGEPLHVIDRINRMNDWFDRHQ